jgi:hypothetical protein
MISVGFSKITSPSVPLVYGFFSKSLEQKWHTNDTSSNVPASIRRPDNWLETSGDIKGLSCKVPGTSFRCGAFAYEILLFGIASPCGNQSQLPSRASNNFLEVFPEPAHAWRQQTYVVHTSGRHHVHRTKQVPNALETPKIYFLRGGPNRGI